MYENDSLYGLQESEISVLTVESNHSRKNWSHTLVLRDSACMLT